MRDIIMAWKKKYGVTRKAKAKVDPEYRKKRNEQSTNDPEARKAYMREYYAKHPEKFKTRTSEQRAKNNAARRKRYAESHVVRAKHKAEVKVWRQANPNKRKSQQLKRYGITLEQYNAMLESQGGKCAICEYSDDIGSTMFPVVDHCHAIGEVRGLLCMNCNQGLGKFMDSIQFLQAAIKYLRKAK